MLQGLSYWLAEEPNVTNYNLIKLEFKKVDILAKGFNSLSSLNMKKSHIFQHNIKNEKFIIKYRKVRKREI
jgi:hypothetical protein